MGMGQSGNTDNTPGNMNHGGMMGMQQDQMFMDNAAQGGLAEVQLGQLAKQNASSEAVKQFGDRMVTDHSKANDELQQLAQKKGVPLPTKPSGKDKKLSKELQAKQGADFDRAYIQSMMKDHKNDIAEFQNQAENGHDPDVKAWAQKMLPILEQHMTQAQQVAAQIGLDTGKHAGAMSGH